MMHTERDAVVVMCEMLLIAGALVAAIYAVAVLIALVLIAFRSRRPLYASFVLSAIASIPLLWALILLWPSLPRELDIDSTIAVLLVFHTVVLSFVWAAPPVQYRLVRRRTRAGPAS